MRVVCDIALSFDRIAATTAHMHACIYHSSEAYKRIVD
jgi:hypothetical protein